MKTNFKKFVSFLCLTVMLITTAVPAMASGESLIFDMESLGIMADMNIRERQNSYVRRDEFAQMVVNMMLQQDVAKSMDNASYFTDVADSKYKGAINLLAQMKYISGSGNSMYNPADYITYAAACKILVHALGYDVITESSDLTSYALTAGKIGVTDGMDSGAQYLTFGQAMIMFDNVLDIGMMIPMYYNNNIAPSYEVDEDRTFRGFLNGKTGTGVVKLRGVVTADISTFLYKPVKNLKSNQLQIGGKTYTLNTTATTGYVGQEVDFYVTYNNYEEGVITAITPTNKNTVYDFSGSWVYKTSSDVIEIRSENVKHKVKIDAVTRFIINNRLDLDYDITKELVASENVVIRTIDNNDDEIADVVYVYDYTDCIIESVSAETNTISFETGFMYGKTKNIKLDEEEIYFEILGADGNNTDIASLKPGDVVSVAMSKDKTAVRLVKGLEPISGVIVSRDGEYITIDDTEYVMGDAIANNNVDLGINVTGYLNFLGVLVDYEKEKLDHNYAYVYTYSKTTGISGGCKIKVLLPEYISIRQVEGSVDELSGEVSTSNSLFVRNKSVVIYSTESKIMFNGVKMNADTALAKVVDKPVSYRFNQNGKIDKIDTLDAVDEVDIKYSENRNECVQLNKKTYNGTEQLFAKGKGSPFAIQEDYTLAFCIPMYSEQDKMTLTDEDLTVFVELSNGLEYESNGYEMDETNEVVDVLVIQRVVNANASIPVVDTSDIGMVVSVSDVLSEDKSTEYKAITMLTEGKEQKFIVSEARVGQSVFKMIEKNDLVQYTIDSFGYINSVKILQKNNAYYESSAESYMYGEVKDVLFNKVSNTKARRVNKVSVGYSNSSDVVNTLELLVRNPAPVFIVQDEEARVGKLSDIQIGDMVYFSIYNTDSIRAVVIKR